MIALMLSASTSLAADVVLVGNSYTAGLPAALNGVFDAASQRVTTTRLASGGLTLADHAARAADPSTPWHTALVAEAADREWVVLQDQSQVPGFPATEPMWQASRDGAVALDQLVRDANAETLFFLTWGRRAGDPMNDWMYPDFATMQERLTSGYQAYAAATATADRPVWIAPVGPAFAVIHDRVASDGLTPTDAGNDFHGLYSGDGSHPSPTGTLLTAYVFFASITGESPVGLEAPAGIDAELADRLQSAAASVVFDPADEFDFPWEAEEDTPDDDDGAGETGDDQDTGRGDCGTDDGSATAGDTAEESAGSTDPTPAAAPEGDPSKRSGCSAALGTRRITGWAAALAGFLVILGRRRR